MRRRVVFAGIVGVVLAGGFVACGIDESGEADGGSDATSSDSPITSDAPIDAPIDVPQACKTLDASACIGDASIPDGWTLAAITPGDMYCPTTVDYDKTSFLMGVTPQGPCLCGCTASGTIDCSGQVEAGTQAGCTGAKSFIFDAGNTAACINTNWSDQHYLVNLLFDASTANVSCDASAPGPGWTAGDATVCTPKCTADFCNVGNTYKRCVISSTSQTCPTGFTKADELGIEAGVQTKCTGCQCAPTATAACGATIQPFNDPDCGTALADASPAGLTCNMTPGSGAGSQVNSFSYAPIVPAAGCNVTAGGTGAAQFTTTITVCCLP